MSAARAAWGDALLVLVAMATVISIFDDTFADRAYLVVGLVPVVVLLALALLTRRAHEGGWWYTLAALVLFSPLGAVVALREPGPYLVPTIDTMSRLLADTVRAPTTLVSTVPPVDPSGVVMLVPYVIGFLAALPAAWLAVASTRPLAPVVPIALGLAATIPLGVLEPTLLVGRGIVLSILLLAWSVARSRRLETGAGGRRGTWAATSTAVLTVALVSVVVSVLVPDDDKSDRVLLTGDAGSPPPAVLDTAPTPEQGVRVLMRATGVPEGRRLRLAVLDEYDGERWVPAEESPGTDGYGTFKRIGRDVAPLHPGRTVVVSVKLREGFTGDWLPTLGELTHVDLDWNPGRTVIRDIRYNQATSSALVVGGVDPRDQYTFEAVLPDETFSRSDPTREPSDDQRQPAGASLDELLGPFDRGGLLPLERVVLLARYLRATGTVVYDQSVQQSPDDLGAGMLGAPRLVGSPFEYSALMALGASRLGVPARVVQGADVGRKGLVYNVDLTSWVELQFADGTWRPLDPERYVGEHVEEEGPRPDLPDAQDFVRDQLAEASKGRDDEIRPSVGSVNPDGTAAVEPGSARRVAVLAAGVLAGLAVVLLLLVPLVKALRRWRRRRTSSWSARWVNGWQEVLDAARDTGSPVPDTWSRVAQAERLGLGLDLARRADAVVFAPAAPSSEESRDFWQECQTVRRQVVHRVGVRRRAWSVLNPASLLAGWARRRAASAGRRSAEVGHEDRRAGGQQAAGA